jgi:hypothetical protein
VDGQPDVRGHKDEFNAWNTRDLADISRESLYLDGSHFRMHEGSRGWSVWWYTGQVCPIVQLEHQVPATVVAR